MFFFCQDLQQGCKEYSLHHYGKYQITLKSNETFDGADDFVVGKNQCGDTGTGDEQKTMIHLEPAEEIPDGVDIFVFGKNQYGELVTRNEQKIQSLTLFEKKFTN